MDNINGISYYLRLDEEQLPIVFDARDLKIAIGSPPTGAPKCQIQVGYEKFATFDQNSL